MTRGIGRILATLTIALTLAASGASSQAAPATAAGSVVTPRMDFRMGPGCGDSAL